MSTDVLILSNLLFNEDYNRKILPFLKEEYFSQTSHKILYKLMFDYVQKYNTIPTKEALIIELNQINDLAEHTFNDITEVLNSLTYNQNTNLDWLIDITEQFCQDKAIYNAIYNSIKILEDKTNKVTSKGSIPKILQDALAVSFDTKIGHDFIEDWEARHKYYNTEFERIPFDLHLMNSITGGGLPKKTLSVFMAGTNVGKAHPNTLLIPTPNGTIQFGELKVGDYVYGSNGKPTKVTGVFPQGFKKTYKVTFSDGRSTLCCGEHLWSASNDNKTWQTISLNDIIKTDLPWYIPLCKPIALDVPLTKTAASPRDMGIIISLFGEDSIPFAYTMNTEEIRLELISGLFSSSPIIFVNNEILKDQIVNLVRSCGKSISVKKTKDKYCLTLNDSKLEMINFEEHSYEDCTCISVEADDHLYLVNDYIVTHNTQLLCHMAGNNLRDGYNVLYITLEMSQEEISKRVDANLLDISMDDIKGISKVNYEKRIQSLKNTTKGKLIVREYPTASASAGNFRHLLDELKLKKKFVPSIIYIDYINICASFRLKAGNKGGSYEYIKAIAEELRGLAVEYDVPVVTATQTNRTGFVSSDVGLEDTAESFGLPQTADFMAALITTEELEEMGQIMVKQLKNRLGDKSNLRRFVIGVDRSHMRFFDAEESEQHNLIGNENLAEDKAVFDSSNFGDEDHERTERQKSKFSFTGFR